MKAAVAGREGRDRRASGELKEQLEQAQRELERAEREADLERAAELRYGEIPELERELAEAEEREPTASAGFLKEEVDAEDVAEVVGKLDRHPGLAACSRARSQKLVHMEERLHQRVIGQDEAVAAVSNALRRSRAGLQRPRPPDRHVPVPRPDRRRQDRAGARAGRVHVRRRRTRWSASTCRSTWRSTPSPRLVGAPPGYVGYDEGGQLTEAVRRRPYSRGPARRDREGPPRRLQHPAAGHGRRPADRRPGPHGRLQERRADHDLEHPRAAGPARRRHFKPEFINRLDDIVEFDAARPRPDRRDRRPPGRARWSARVARARDRGRAHRRARATLLGNLGYDPTYGARPLKRVIQKQPRRPARAGASSRASSARATPSGRRGRGRARLHQGSAGRLAAISL